MRWFPASAALRSFSKVFFDLLLIVGVLCIIAFSLSVNGVVSSVVPAIFLCVFVLCLLIGGPVWFLNKQDKDMVERKGNTVVVYMDDIDFRDRYLERLPKGPLSIVDSDPDEWDVPLPEDHKTRDGK